MKKLVFMFVALAAISFASCGDKAKSNTTNDTTQVETNPDSTKTGSAATNPDSVKTGSAATNPDNAKTATPAK